MWFDEKKKSCRSKCSLIPVPNQSCFFINIPLCIRRSAFWIGRTIFLIEKKLVKKLKIELHWCNLTRKTTQRKKEARTKHYRISLLVLFFWNLAKTKFVKSPYVVTQKYLRKRKWIKILILKYLKSVPSLLVCLDSHFMISSQAASWSTLRCLIIRFMVFWSSRCLIIWSIVFWSKSSSFHFQLSPNVLLQNNFWKG